MTPDLFVGLVTHPRSRFPEARGDEGLAGLVVRGTVQAGLDVVLHVCNEDLLADHLEINPAEVRASIRAELDTERRWRTYVRGGGQPWWLGVFMRMRREWRQLKFAPTWGGESARDSAGIRMVRRLANIELAHLQLMDAALASEARWVLLLEDDAGSADAGLFARELARFIASHDSVDQPGMVSLAESFSVEDLGIAPLLTPVEDADSAWSLLRAERPVTNTVCAMLYRRPFLEHLRSRLAIIPLSPVIPIDFKLNEALMRMAPVCPAGDAWLASPAPLTQRSGVPTVRVG